MKRMFIAIPVPLELSRALRECARPLLQSLGRREIPYRPTPEGHDHLTLAFLGMLDVRAEALAIEAMDEAGAGSGPLDLRVTGPDAFPNPRSARVLFAALGESPGLRRLHSRLTDALRARGLPVEDRAFHPHLTLARLPRPARLECALDSEWDSSRLAPLPAREIALYESRAETGGHRYHVVAQTPLPG